MSALGMVAVFISKPAYIDKDGRSISGCRFYVLIPEDQLFPVCSALSDAGYRVHIDESYWSKTG